MKLAFTLPETPTIKVIYSKGGTNYSAVIPNPQSTDSLLCTMLDKQVGASQIVRLEPIQPRQELHRGHPAQHRMAKYVALTACVAFILGATISQTVELPASVIEWQNVC
jgi:hypothetical protein